MALTLFDLASIHSINFVAVGSEERTQNNYMGLGHRVQTMRANVWTKCLIFVLTNVGFKVRRV